MQERYSYVFFMRGLGGGKGKLFRGGVLSALAKCVPQRNQGIEKKQKEIICPVIWSIYDNLARDGYKESTRCCVQARF